MNVIYAVSHLPEWVDVAQKNQVNLDWTPVYWITNSITEPLVQKAFPETIRQSYQDILALKSPAGMNLFDDVGIDEEMIKRYALYERVSLKMMDRFVESAKMSYDDRKHFYYRLLIYSHKLIAETKADLMILTEIPHHVAQYVLYAVARESGVQLAMFAYLPFYKERFVLLRGIEDHPLSNQNVMDDGSFGEEVSEMIREYLATITGERDKAVMPHMIKQKRTSGLFYIALSFIKRTFNKIRNSTNSERVLGMLKSREGLIQLLPMSYSRYTILRFKALRKKRLLKKAYHQLSEDVDLDQKYVYVPLHYQPERTTIPDGGIYSDQWLMVNLISVALPKGWKIYVKEHPTQFHPRYDGQLGRHISDYHRLLAIDNVHLVSIKTNSLLLADRSKAVISVNSSVTFEAFFRRTPAVVFAKNNWLINWEGVFHARDEASLKVIFEKIQEGITYGDDSSFELMKKLHKSSREIRMLPKHNTWMSAEENATRLHQVFANLEKQLMKEQSQ